jgi:hypothetical protein
MSKGSSRPPQTVVWNPMLRLWLKVPQKVQEGDLLPEDSYEPSVPYSATWPPSGSMRNGCASLHPRQAPPTAGNASSSSPGRLLPTPRTSDTNGPGLHGDGGPDLRTVISLLPTPTVADSRDTANFRPDGTPYSSGYGMTLTDATRLLPTPRASDGANQRGSSGDLMLPSAVAHLLPTPTASDGERTSSTYGRGNPTLTGAITDPPSDAGNPSSDAPPPGQPTLWDD